MASADALEAIAGKPALFSTPPTARDQEFSGAASLTMGSSPGGRLSARTAPWRSSSAQPKGQWARHQPGRADRHFAGVALTAKGGAPIAPLSAAHGSHSASAP